MKRFLTILTVVAAVIAEGASSIPWRMPDYSLTAREMDVRQTIETFAVAEGLPVVISDNVKGTFSGKLENVPAAEFLDRIATIHNLIWYYDGATLWVYASGEILTTLIDLRYMKAMEVLELMRELGVEDTRFPLKEASNGELIMVSGPPRYVALVSEMIGKADRLREQRTFTEVETRLFPLVHTWADDVSFNGNAGGESSVPIRGVASLLQELMEYGNEGTVKDGTNVVEAASNGRIQPIIRAENRLNAVLVRDAVSRMPMYADLISKLDRPQKLVEIGVTVLEMTKEDAMDWQASLGAGLSEGRSQAGAGMNVDNLMAVDSLTGLGASGGYSYLGNHVNVDASIIAQKSKGRTRNIFRTSILTLNNMVAEITDTESYSTKLVGEKVANVDETSAGTKLAVKPRVVEPPAGMTNGVRQIWLTMELKDGGFDKLSTVDELPTKRQTSLTTQAALPENGSLLLAGYFRDIDEEAAWGIPFLRSIPLIGWLFGGSYTVKTTVQRMFILTPHVVNIDYFIASTNDVVTAQMLRNRDVSNENALVDSAKSGDWVRKNNEAELKAQRELRDDEERENFKRNEKERDLRKEKWEASMEKSHEEWKDDFQKREEEWEKSKDSDGGSDQ